MSPRPHREAQHPNLASAIKEAAWSQLAELGAAAFNLRGIARDLGIAAPSIYTYFPNRDALVTALIVEAYTSLAEAQLAALPEQRPTDHAERLAALGFAYRTWAVTYPQRYLLIFGTPIPNYHAPAEITTPAAAQSLHPLMQVIWEAHSAGVLRVERFAPMTPQLQTMLSAWQTMIGNVDLEVLYMALVIWSRVHGLVMIELTNHMPPSLDDPAELFRREIEHMRRQYL
ncbi:MAG: TetR/AcrR family transcriptional regulator [Oscillochloridaceae bacterium umkhey_bin13]